MFGQRRRRRTNTDPTLGQRLDRNVNIIILNHDVLLLLWNFVLCRKIETNAYPFSH